jgi:hypothetical protein
MASQSEIPFGEDATKKILKLDVEGDLLPLLYP